MDRDWRDHRTPRGRDLNRPLPAGRRSLRGHEHFQPDSSAHAAAQQRPVGHASAHPRTGRAGHAQASVVRGVRRGFDPGLHSAHLLLLVHQCLSEFPARR